MEPLLEASEGIASLRFGPELERQFRLSLFRRSIRPARVVLVVALCTIAFAGLGDFAGPSRGQYDWPLRYGFLCPILTALIPLSYHRRFATIWQPVLAFTILLIGGGSLVMSLTSEAAFAQQGVLNVMVLMFASYTLVRLLFLNAVLVCWSLIAAWAVLATRTETIDPGVLWSQAFYILTANALGMLAANTIEAHLRRDFLLQRGLDRARRRSQELLLNILPGPIAERLKVERCVIADSFADVSVLFADIVDFSPLSARMTPEQVVDLLNRVFSRFDAIAESHGVEKIKTIGDGYMAAAGVPEACRDSAGAAVRMGLEMLETVREMSAAESLPIRLRIGVNTGPVMAGVIGTRKFIYDLWGETVNIAKRMEAHGIADEVQVSLTTASALAGKFGLEERGPITVKGCGPCTVYLVRGTATGGAVPALSSP